MKGLVLHLNAIDLSIKAVRQESRYHLVQTLGNAQRRTITEKPELLHGDGCMIYRVYTHATGTNNYKVSEITLPPCNFLKG